MARSSRARVCGGTDDNCLTQRSCIERGHCASRTGRSRATASGSSCPSRPSTSAASFGGAVCKVSLSWWMASSPKVFTISANSSQSSRKPECPNRLVTYCSVEAQRPGSSQSLRPRIGAEERVPEFVEESLRSGEIADGLPDILALMPKATLQYVTNRFGHSGFREDCELLAEIVKTLGEDAIHQLSDTLQTDRKSTRLNSS